MEDFTNRIRALPRNRRQETLVVLRTLIKDMHEAGYSANRIARELEKSHATILFHYKVLGLDVADAAWRREAEERRIFSDELRAQRMLARIQFQKERDAARKLLGRARVEKKKSIEEARQWVLKLYKKGKTYEEIRYETGFLFNRIEALLRYTAEWREFKKQIGQSSRVGKPVTQKTLAGAFVKTWGSASEAARSMGCARNNITSVCKGRERSAAGYRWEYAKRI